MDTLLCNVNLIIVIHFIVHQKRQKWEYYSFPAYFIKFLPNILQYHFKSHRVVSQSFDQKEDENANIERDFALTYTHWDIFVYEESQKAKITTNRNSHLTRTEHFLLSKMSKCLAAKSLKHTQHKHYNCYAFVCALHIHWQFGI